MGSTRRRWGARVLWATAVLVAPFPPTVASPPGAFAGVEAEESCPDPVAGVGASASETVGDDGGAPLLHELDPVDLGIGTREAAVTTATPIQVWFHVITADSVVPLAPSDVDLAKQLAVMNDSFSGATGGAASPFSFVHAGTKRVQNPDWYGFGQRTDAEAAAKAALREGDARTLNVYITDTAGGGSWATFPWSYRHEPGRDGIVVDRKHVANLVLEGDTAVHETGHWLGLYHTFQGYDFEQGDGGGCGGRGDYVDDTPAEDTPSDTRCDEARDTCPAEGNDPVHNFMDYSGDLCTHEFTAGQVTRMGEQWSTYRAARGKGGRARTR